MNEAASNGDPHLYTFDNGKYDFQAVGEFILSKSLIEGDSFEVQVRQRAWASRMDVAVTQASAMNVAGDRVGFYEGQEPVTRINEVPQELPEGEFALPGGGKINRSGNLYVVKWPTDSGMVKIRDNSWGLLVRAYVDDAKKGRLVGLLGNADGNPGNDLVMRSGEELGSVVPFGVLYPGYADSWRIEQDESLFDYAEGETTETFTDRSFPRVLVSAAGLSEEARAHAEQLCRDAGIVNRVLLEDCILDVTLTEEDGFAQQQLNFADPQTTLKVEPPPAPVFGDVGFGRFEGLVYDAVTEQVLDGARVELTVNGAPLPGVSTHETENGAYSTDVVPAGSGYRVSVLADGYITEQVLALTALDREASRVESVKLLSSELASLKGVVTGKVRNALDNSGVSNITVKARRYLNNESGEVLKTTETDGYGNYRISGLYSGNYTLEFHGAEYLTNYIPVQVAGEKTTAFDALISPVLGSSEFRFVLSWGETPEDLDVHLTVPNGGGERYYIYYNNKGNMDAYPYARLDIDDADGYGPETVTISKLLQGEGNYRYTVHDFANGGSTSSNALAGSNAKVEVYSGNYLTETFHVPNSEGTMWTVFEMDGTGKLLPVNEMGYEVNQGGILRSRSVGRSDSTLNHAPRVQTDYWTIRYQSTEKHK